MHRRPVVATQAPRGRERDVKRGSGRAQRFAVHVPVRFRSAGAVHWRQGRIENISRTGLLFWTEHLLDVDTPLEMSFVLPVGVKKPAIVCRGRVVRTVLPATRETPTGLAASISTYHFVRGRVVAA